MGKLLIFRTPLAGDEFETAVKLEESQPEEAGRLYGRLIEHKHAAAAINWGTMLYKERRYEEAAALYRTATTFDPHYALAFFNLGNALDESRKPSEAIAAYRRAVELRPDYADAHYNLALALQKSGQRNAAAPALALVSAQRSW